MDTNKGFDVVRNYVVDEIIGSSELHPSSL